jgi:hypothetical protein
MQAYHLFAGKFRKMIDFSLKVTIHKDIKVIREIANKIWLVTSEPVFEKEQRWI